MATPRKASRTKTAFCLPRQRLRELERIVRDRHRTIPETDDAGVYLDEAARCFRAIAAGNARAKPVEAFALWCQTWAPWADSAEIFDAALGKIRRSETYGREIRLSDHDRTRLAIRTIGAFDLDKQAREKRQRASKRQRDRERARAKREAAGALSRDEYLAGCLSRRKPWVALGISRRTYERRKAAGTLPPVASPSLYHLSLMGRPTCDNDQRLAALRADAFGVGGARCGVRLSPGTETGLASRLEIRGAA